MLSLGLLALAYSTIDTGALLNTLSRMSFAGVLGVLGLYTVSQLVSACKWQMILSAARFESKTPASIQAYFFGMFVNTFGLGTLGGDLARALSLPAGGGSRSLAIASVISDRIHGLLTLLAIGLLAIIVVRPATLGPLAVYLAGASLLTLVAALLLAGRYMRPLITDVNVAGRILSSLALAFPIRPRYLIPCTLVSSVSHLLQISMHSVMAAELGCSISFAYLLAVIPLVNILSSLPISVQGAGVRELLYVFFLVPLGVPKETAVAFGAIWLVSVTLVSALGGLFFPMNNQVKIAANRDDFDSEIIDSSKINVS